MGCAIGFSERDRIARKENETMVRNMADEQQTLLDERALAEATSDPGARIEQLRREIDISLLYCHLCQKRRLYCDIAPEHASRITK